MPSKGNDFFCVLLLRAVVWQNVDFIGGSKKKNFGRNVSISDVRYAMKSPFTCDHLGLGPSSRRRCLHNFFAWSRPYKTLLKCVDTVGSRNLNFQSTPLALKLRDHFMSRSMMTLPVALSKGLSTTRQVTLSIFDPRVCPTVSNTE